jgi:hypothetical protein
MTAELENVKTKEKIEIAVATDTVLYLPFYLSYYNKDFAHTPFSNLEVVIIGTNNDFRFVGNKKLKGDGFATFAVLLKLADAAICDPSFLVFLSGCENSELIEEFKNFQELLTSDTKAKICDKSYDKDLHNCLDISKDGHLEIKNVDLFRKAVLLNSTQVIGGMVSKIAFVAVGSYNLFNQKHPTESLGACYLPNHVPSQFGLKNIKNKFYYYQTPSTGHCIGNMYYQQYVEKIPQIEGIQVDFGEELQYLIKNQPTTDDSIISNPSYAEDSVSFSCDYISVDYLLDKHNDGKDAKIAALEDLAFDGQQHYMFSGLIANTRKENTAKLQSLLYCVDFNLFKIKGYFKKNDTSGLIQFLKTKLKYIPEKQDELLNLLIADNTLKAVVKHKINASENDYTFETLLKYYVDRLNNWNKVGGLYYPDTAPKHEDLASLAKLRNQALGHVEVKYNYSKLVSPDLLADHRVRERKYFKLEKYVGNIPVIIFRSLFTPLLLLLYPLAGLLKLFLLIFRKKQDIGETFMDRIITQIESAFWAFLRTPTLLYFFGSLFIVLELISSLFHLTGFHGISFYEYELPITYHYQYPGEPNSHFTIVEHLALGKWIFWAFIWFLLTSFFTVRKLLLYKRDSQYFYRND